MFKKGGGGGGGGEGQSRKCVGKTRSADHSSPEKLCERALRRREGRTRRGITEKLTRQRRHERTTEEKHVEDERNEKDRGEIEGSIKNTVIASTIGKKEDQEIGNPNTEGPDRQNQNNSYVEDRDEEDRTETFQTPNARVATDTQTKNKKKSTLRKGLTKTTQDTLIKYNLANKP